MSALRELYQEVILDHNKSPRNFRKIEDANRTVEGFNPLCGDHYTLYLIVEGGVIKDISFEGTGCAISKASASVMSSLVKGKSAADVDVLFNKFHGLVTGSFSAESEVEGLGKLAAFSGVSEFPARVKCATLAWHTLKAGLQQNEKIVTTE